MARCLLARRLALTGCACASLAVAGCTTTAAKSSGTSVSGTTLSIYQSVPPGTLSPETQDVLAAERLAFERTGGRVGRFKLKLVPSARRELSANARQAIGDATTIAYLGELDPGASADTLGITNAEYVLQVSPTDTAVELTRSTSAISGTPDRYYESLRTNGRTFARVVPTDTLEAEAVASRMQALGVKRLYVPSDGSAYGAALRSALVRHLSAGISVVSGSSGADAIFYAGSSVKGSSGADAVFDQAANANPKVLLFAPSALDRASFGSSLAPAAQRQLYVSSPGFTSANLSAQGRQFVAAFRAAYGHAPATQAVFGYVAMAGVIHALQSAGASAGNRATVVHDFFAIRNLSSAVGTFSIDKNGDTSVAPIVISRVRAGKLVPIAQLQG